MKRILALLLAVCGGLALVAAQEPGEYAAPDIKDQKRPLKLLVTVSGQPFEDAAFAAMLDALPEVKWTKAVMPRDAGLLKPGLEKDYEAVLFADMYERTPAERKALSELMSKRMGFVVMNLANPTWAAGPDMVGGKVASQSGAASKVAVKLTEAASPITRGVKDFVLTDRLAPAVARGAGVVPVLRADSAGAGDDALLAWSLMYGDPYGLSRVLVMRVGQQRTAWDDPNFRRVLGQGLRWTACAAWGRFC